MISPKNVKRFAQKKEEENYAFRTFLKENAEPQEFDEKVNRLHRELFTTYDCSKCRNCCKEFHSSIPVEDIEQDAKYLKIDAEEFKRRFLELDKHEEGFITRHKPCDFLQPDGNCLLGECRPHSCKEYPHTNKPDRIESLLSMLENAEVCPVVYEIIERLKQDPDYEAFDEEYVEEFRKMTRLFQKHAPTGMMPAKDWFKLQHSAYSKWTVGRDEEGAMPFQRTEKAIGRNDPCPCGSGKKYKKCCGRLEQ